MKFFVKEQENKFSKNKKKVLGKNLKIICLIFFKMLTILFQKIYIQI